MEVVLGGGGEVVVVVLDVVVEEDVDDDVEEDDDEVVELPEAFSPALEAVARTDEPPWVVLVVVELVVLEVEVVEEEVGAATPLVVDAPAASAWVLEVLDPDTFTGGRGGTGGRLRRASNASS